MKLNKKGVSIIELIISVALIAIIMLFMYRLLSDISFEKNNDSFAFLNQEKRVVLIKTIENKIRNDMRITKIEKNGDEIRFGNSSKNNLYTLKLQKSGSKPTITMLFYDENGRIIDKWYFNGVTDITFDSLDSQSLSRGTLYKLSYKVFTDNPSNKDYIVNNMETDVNIYNNNIIDDIVLTFVINEEGPTLANGLGDDPDPTPSGGDPSGETPSGGDPSGGTPSGETPSGGDPSGGTTPSGNQELTHKVEVWVKAEDGSNITSCQPTVYIVYQGTTYRYYKQNYVESSFKRYSNDEPTLLWMKVECTGYDSQTVQYYLSSDIQHTFYMTKPQSPNEGYWFIPDSVYSYYNLPPANRVYPTLFELSNSSTEQATFSQAYAYYGNFGIYNPYGNSEKKFYACVFATTDICLSQPYTQYITSTDYNTILRNISNSTGLYNCSYDGTQYYCSVSGVNSTQPVNFTNAYMKCGVHRTTHTVFCEVEYVSGRSCITKRVSIDANNNIYCSSTSKATNKRGQCQ